MIRWLVVRWLVVWVVIASPPIEIGAIEPAADRPPARTLQLYAVRVGGVRSLPVGQSAARPAAPISIGGGLWPAQADETLTLAEYQGRLDQLIWGLSRAQSGAESEAVATARAALAGVKAVQLPSGETIQVQPLLIDNLSRSEAVARLTLMRDQLAASAQDNTASRLETLRGVLARREFRTISQEPSLWERFWNWLRQVWPENLRPPEGSTPVISRGVVWLIAAIGGTLGALLLSYWLQGFLSNFVADAEARRRQAAGEAMPLTAAQARQQAQSLAQAGSYRQAMRHLYLSALLHLEERGLLRYDRGQTNREYLAQANVAPVREHLQPVIETFDEVWYGVQEPDRDTFETYEREVAQLESARIEDRRSENNIAAH